MATKNKASGGSGSKSETLAILPTPENGKITGNNAAERPPAIPPTERMKARLHQARESVAGRKARLSLWIEHDDPSIPAKIGTPHSDADGWRAHFLDAFGTDSEEFAGAMLGQLGMVLAIQPNVMDRENVNAALAAIDGAAPRDEIEAMLLVQMAATHCVAMSMLGRAKFSNKIPGMQEYGTLATKLLRTYAAQCEALAKLRRGGQQTVRVEHVHVYPGGQAVVGSVTTGTGGAGGGFVGNGQQPHEPAIAAALSYAPGSEVWGAEQIRETVPVSGGEGEAALPAARRRERKRGARGAT